MLNFSQFINENFSLKNRINDYLLKGKYLYHYTLTENVDSIKNDGLIPRFQPNSYYENVSDGIYLTTSYSIDIVNLPESLMELMNDYYENNDDYDNSPLTRLTIYITQLDYSKFTYDDDYILNIYNYNKAITKEDKIIESLEIWRAIVYQGNMPSNLITKYEFV